MTLYLALTGKFCTTFSTADIMSCSTYRRSATSGEMLLVILFKVSRRHDTSSNELGISREPITSDRVAKLVNSSLADADKVLKHA